MRRLPREESRGRRWSPERRWRSWWALHLQRRRRFRHVAHLVTSPLLVGLHSFYEPTPGTTHCRSWNETEALPEDAFAGAQTPQVITTASGYAAGRQVYYFLYPFREAASGRIYSGQWYGPGWLQGTGSDPFVVQWPAWSSPGWLDGVTVLRIRNDLSTKGWRDLSLATLEAGWTDDDTGWDHTSLLHGWSNPVPVARAMWCTSTGGGVTEPMPVVSSALGGWAFDSTGGRILVRTGGDELMRDLEGTTAFWVNTDVNISGQFTRLGGVNGIESEVYFSLINGLMKAYDQWIEASLAGSAWDDWFLVVHRSDPVANLVTVDLFRQRDGAHVSSSGGQSSLNYRYVLTPASDYVGEGYRVVNTLGGSCWWGRYGTGRFDRLGLWDRALTDDEVLELFNYGLGWQPG